MLRIVLALLCLLAALAPARAQTPTIAFGGDELVRKHEQANAQAGIVEFVPADESIDGWTRLVGLHMFWDHPGSPSEAAAALAQTAEQNYPGTKPRLGGEGSESLVDFVIAAPGGEFVEFNVFKYARGPDGRGIVAFQYARRFRGLAAEDVRRLGARWIAEAARFDMNFVRAAFRRPAALAPAKPP